MSIKLESHPDYKSSAKRLAGRGVTGPWTHGIPELRVGAARFIYLGGEVLECTALVECAQCHRAWGDFSLCEPCAETAKRCRVVRHRRLAQFNTLREREPRSVPNAAIWQMVDLIQELS